MAAGEGREVAPGRRGGAGRGGRPCGVEAVGGRRAGRRRRTVAVARASAARGQGTRAGLGRAGEGKENDRWCLIVIVRLKNRSLLTQFCWSGGPYRI